MTRKTKRLDFTRRKCRSCEGRTKPYTEVQIHQLLTSLPEWEYRDGSLVRAFEFMNFYQTMAFVNAVAWLANLENHHPDMAVGYSRCVIRYNTHAIGGISENDFICAAKINAMLAL
ncbi:MAG: 4a-hydroxytetrahydrobiopterin dehydratase [Phycisphaerae bacterium]